MKYKQISGLPKLTRGNDGWAKWRDEVMQHRATVLRETQASHPDHKRRRAEEIEKCRADHRYLANVYGTIYEAREGAYDTDRGKSDAGYLPFIMYPFQIEVWDWLDERYESNGDDGDGLIVKSRAMGLSNIVGFWIACKWMMVTPFQARIASRVEALVDATGDPDAVFWKIDTFLQGLPAWLFQAFCPGFSWKQHRVKLQIRNPRNGNTVKGESTTANMGRGGRASVIFYDEAAFMENFGRIWTAGRASSPHRIAVSTVNIDAGMDFHDLHKGKSGYKSPPVLEIPWNAHPLHDEEWLRRELARDTIEGIRREVLMDYFAGGGEWVYPESHTKEVGEFPFEPYAGPVFGTIDDGFDDEWAMHLIQYNVVTGRHRVLESYRNKHKKVDFYGALMTGVPRTDLDWGDDELAFVRVIQLVPGVTWVGDPHIANREQIAGMSVFTHLAENYNIHVMYDMNNRDHVGRRVALSHLIPLIDFNNTPRVSYALEALKRNRYRSQKPGMQVQTEAKSAIHDDTSHPVTAFEWYAINFENVRHMFRSQIKWEGDPNE